MRSPSLPVKQNGTQPAATKRSRVVASLLRKHCPSSMIATKGRPRHTLPAEHAARSHRPERAHQFDTQGGEVIHGHNVSAVLRHSHLEPRATDPRRALREVLLELRTELPDRRSAASTRKRCCRSGSCGAKSSASAPTGPSRASSTPALALPLGREPPERRIGLPVKRKTAGTLSYHVWYPGCPMEEDAFGILKPKDTEQFEPQLLLVPMPRATAPAARVGYGGGFVARTLRARQPELVTVGLAYSVSWVPGLQALTDEAPLDAILTDEGVVWGSRKRLHALAPLDWPDHTF